MVKVTGSGGTGQAGAAGGSDESKPSTSEVGSSTAGVQNSDKQPSFKDKLELLKASLAEKKTVEQRTKAAAILNRNLGQNNYRVGSTDSDSSSSSSSSSSSGPSLPPPVRQGAYSHRSLSDIMDERRSHTDGAEDLDTQLSGLSAEELAELDDLLPDDLLKGSKSE